jgi:hypothetical protein
MWKGEEEEGGGKFFCKGRVEGKSVCCIEYLTE